MKPVQLNETVATKVLQIVDAGLSSGRGIVSRPPEWEFTRFSKVDGSPIKTIADVAETTAASAHHSELAELWGVTIGDAVVCYTGNGPSSKKHAQLITSLHNSHSTLTEENARLAERVRVLEGELKKIRSVIPMNFLIAHDTPGATGPTDALDLVGAIRSLVHNARKWEARARSALHTTPEVGE